MKTAILSIVLTHFFLFGYGQIIVDFEKFDISVSSFLNGSEHSGGFDAGPVFMPNNYDENYAFWSGWAISSMTDSTTPGFSNQYSAITAGGVDGSQNYAVAYNLPGENRVILNEAHRGKIVNGLFITNTTYAYLSMLNGDSFAKRFGGEEGNDPDYYFLSIKKYYQGGLSMDSVNFYLADYSFDDNSLDYIVNDWTYVDLTGLGPVDSLAFTLYSSDTGIFGINTPTYFAVDNIIVNDVTASDEININAPELEFYPNPVHEMLTLRKKDNKATRISIYTIYGERKFSREWQTEQTDIDVSGLTPGMYILHLNYPKMERSYTFAKK